MTPDPLLMPSGERLPVVLAEIQILVDPFQTDRSIGNTSLVIRSHPAVPLEQIARSLRHAAEQLDAGGGVQFTTCDPGCPGHGAGGR